MELIIHQSRKGMHRLNLYDRQKLAFWCKRRISRRALARLMGRDHSVILRELARNKGEYLSYEPDRAQHFAERRARKRRKTKFEKYPALKEYVTQKIKEGLSPEQV